MSQLRPPVLAPRRAPRPGRCARGRALFLIFALAIFTACANLDILSELDRANVQLYESALPSCYAVNQTVYPPLFGPEFVQGSTGAGFAWDDRHIITAAHVICPTYAGMAPIGNPVVTDSNNVRIVCDLVGLDAVRDVAVLRLPEGVRGQPLKHAATPPRHGAAIYHIGTPQGHEFSMSIGTLSSRGMVEYRSTANINHGDSGGAALNSDGELVGMLSAVEGVGPLGLFVPLARIRAAWTVIHEAGNP